MDINTMDQDALKQLVEKLQADKALMIGFLRQIAELPEQDSFTPGPWDFAKFRPIDGGEFTDIEQIVARIENSVRQSDSLELWGITTPDDEDGECLVICHTGNGPTSRANAKALSLFPDIVTGAKRTIEKVTEQD